jgi:hypothetical protein
MTIEFISGRLAETASLKEASLRLGEYLGLEGEAPEAATRRALNEPLYLKALCSVRRMPSVLDQLLANELGIAGPPAAEKKYGAGQLVATAAASLLKWGAQGLPVAKPWVIESRLAACDSCEHQQAAPDTLVYRGAKVAVGKDAKICTLCGCLTNTKAAIATELCPSPDPHVPGRSRWGEPWVDPNEHPKGPW